MTLRLRPSLKLNIPLLYAVAFFGGLIFWVGIEKLFLLSIGGDGFSVSLNAVVFVAVVLALDIPTGALADRWGRKSLMIIGLASLFLSSLTYGLANSPDIYLIGTVLFGIALATINGATQALTYDTLKELGSHESYNKIYGRITAALAIGAGTGLLVSGSLAQEFGFRFNFRLALVPTTIALCLSFFLIEPRLHKFKANAPKLKIAIKESALTIRKSSPLIATAVLLLTVRTFQWMSDNYSQLVLNKFGIKLSLISVVGFLAVSGGALGRLLAHRFYAKGRVIILIMITLFACVGFAPEPIALVGLITFYGFNQLLENICETDIQQHLPSHIRATATSVFSFFSTLLIIPFGLITGVIIKRYNVLAAFQLAAILGAAALAWSLFKGKNLKTTKELSPPPTDLLEPIQ